MAITTATEPGAADRPRDIPLYPARVVPPTQELGTLAFIPAFIRNPLAVVPQAAYDEPFLFTHRAGRPVLWITEPDWIKTVFLDERDKYPRPLLEKRVLGPLLGNGLLTANGADWKWQRQTAAPIFRHQDLLRLVPAMSASTERMLQAWRRDSGTSVRQIERDMTEVTFDIICATLLPGGETHVRPNLERANGDFLGPISWRMVYGIFNVPHWMPHPGKARMAGAETTLRAGVAELLAERRADPKPHDDLMQRLMDARDPESGRPMSDELLIDNLLTFFMAGHETTAKALTWTLYLLANAPHWAKGIEAEVAEVAGSAPIDARHIDRLVLTQQVLKESMRLYPPAPIISRVAGVDTELGGQKLAAGTQVVVPIYAAHRHRKRWIEPDRFDPTRFTPANEARIPRYQYMPFGAGPRICIGMAFAMIEATAILATIVRAASFKPVRGHYPEPISRVTLRPKGGMPLKVILK
jgi:cytochrome P450